MCEMRPEAPVYKEICEALCKMYKKARSAINFYALSMVPRYTNMAALTGMV